MKKIGMYTARGVVSENDTTNGTPQKIPLFDGSFKTAYRVVEFYIWGVDVGGGSTADAVGKLSKNAIGAVGSSNFMRADDDNQVAWAGSGAGGDFLNDIVSIIDPDNLIVEDLYVYARSGNATTADPINYLVIMEKYEITDWQGALAMARDRMQGDL